MPSILTSPIYTDVRYYWGDPQVPHEVKYQRRYTSEAMRAVGTPVLLKSMYNAEDAQNGDAVESPTMDDTYDATTYANDYLSYGVGYVSVDTQAGEWYNTQTFEVVAQSSTPSGPWAPAPRYRGYGPGFLAYAILPDMLEDVWKLDPRGALIRQQNATVQLPWWPQMGDNDLLITCSLNPNGLIAETYERYQLKNVTPITMRGHDQMGFREAGVMANASGNRYWVGQQCEMNKVPDNDILYALETDR